MSGRKRLAFSLGEVIVAIGVFAIAVLTLMALAISLTRMDQETVDRSLATDTAVRLLEQTIRNVRNAGDPVPEADFWANSYPEDDPLLTGIERVGSTNFNFLVTVSTPLLDLTTGEQIGTTGPENRLKKVTVRLTWFSEPGKERQGYGALETRVSRLVREGEVW